MAASVGDFDSTSRIRYELQFDGNPPNIFVLNPEQIQHVIHAFNQQFASIEASHPAKGYEFHVLGGKKLEAYLEACDRRPESEALELPPQGDKCPFCRPSPQDGSLAHELVTKQGNPLVVSVEHEDHWFKLSEDQQVAMLLTANKVLQAYGKDGAKHHLYMHIGTHGHQTVRHAHIHLETGLGGGARK